MRQAALRLFVGLGERAEASVRAHRCRRPDAAVFRLLRHGDRRKARCGLVSAHRRSDRRSPRRMSFFFPTSPKNSMPRAPPACRRRCSLARRHIVRVDASLRHSLRRARLRLRSCSMGFLFARVVSDEHRRRKPDRRAVDRLGGLLVRRRAQREAGPSPGICRVARRTHRAARRSPRCCSGLPDIARRLSLRPIPARRARNVLHRRRGDSRSGSASRSGRAACSAATGAASSP